MGGLFFMFMALISLVSQVPFIGSALALMVLPAATVGLMAATRSAVDGKFPMPAVLFTAFRSGAKKTQSILMLGALYAIGFLLVLGVSALFDGGQFASFYLSGGAMTKEIVSTSEFQMATWAAMALYLPLSLMFWHAPALVHWHDVSPVKALFFSFVACFKNFAAMVVYFFMWLAVFSLGGLVLTMLAIATGSESAVRFIMLPAALLMAAMFFTSIYYGKYSCNRRNSTIVCYYFFLYALMALSKSAYSSQVLLPQIVAKSSKCFSASAGLLSIK
jgi:hypothetical protein